MSTKLLHLRCCEFRNFFRRTASTPPEISSSRLASAAIFCSLAKSRSNERLFVYTPGTRRARLATGPTCVVLEPRLQELDVGPGFPQPRHKAVWRAHRDVGIQILLLCDAATGSFLTADFSEPLHKLRAYSFGYPATGAASFTHLGFPLLFTCRNPSK